MSLGSWVLREPGKTQNPAQAPTPGKGPIPGALKTQDTRPKTCKTQDFTSAMTESMRPTWRRSVVGFVVVGQIARRQYSQADKQDRTDSPIHEATQRRPLENEQSHVGFPGHSPQRCLSQRKPRPSASARRGRTVRWAGTIRWPGKWLSPTDLPTRMP